MKKGSFEVKNSRVVYQNPWITVREDCVIRPDGSDGIFGIVEYSPGVSILAINKNNEVYLITEYMYAIERMDTMLPAGGVDDGEELLTAAKRELLEETGLVSSEWIDLGSANPLTMVIKAPFFNFMALGVEKTGKGEQGIKVSKHSFSEILEMIRDGRITHSGTIATIFKAKMYFEARGSKM